MCPGKLSDCCATGLKLCNFFLPHFFFCIAIHESTFARSGIILEKNKSRRCELWIAYDLKDKRKYKGDKSIKSIPKSFVIKIKETKTGANIEFFDVRKKTLMTKESFILSIKQGKYPGYAVRRHQSGEFPYSTRDRFSFNNLG